MLREPLTRSQNELIVIANFVEVFLARENHDGLIGVNYLEKIQLPTLPSLWGAMLAHVDYVLMGAGIPRHIPKVLDQFSQGKAAELPLNLVGMDPSESYVTRFDPRDFSQGDVPWTERPKFLAIVASSVLANRLAKKGDGGIDGFIVEGPSAGGHNAAPRGVLKLNQDGEPVYGSRDQVDLEKFRALALPFWLAGSYGSPERVAEALSQGAVGVQVGTAFAFCEESDLSESIKAEVLQQSRDGCATVQTDPVASPTGFPFKVLQMEGTVSDTSVYEQRERVCDLGFLREGVRNADGKVIWRCPGEPVEQYLNKGGKVACTPGKKCVCNGLFANIGLGQHRKRTGAEAAMVTCGNEVHELSQFLPTPSARSYSAEQVVRYLLSAVACC